MAVRDRSRCRYRASVGVTSIRWGAGRTFGSAGRRRIGPQLALTSIGLAAGTGVAVGIELRSALHRSAGVAPGSLSTGPQRRASVREQDKIGPRHGRRGPGKSPSSFSSLLCALHAQCIPHRRDGVVIGIGRKHEGDRSRLAPDSRQGRREAVPENPAPPRRIDATSTEPRYRQRHRFQPPDRLTPPLPGGPIRLRPVILPPRAPIRKPISTPFTPRLFPDPRTTADPSIPDPSTDPQADNRPLHRPPLPRAEHHRRLPDSRS